MTGFVHILADGAAKRIPEWRFDGLSQREKEVLGHVVRGKMNKEIALDLAINLRTVKLHRTNATRKLKVQSVAELTRLADEAGLFEA